MGDKIFAEHVTGALRRFFRAFNNLYATALAASASVNLRFDDCHGTAQLERRRLRLVRRRRDDPTRHNHAETLKDSLGLKFVNIHD
jgi:hypothetical protein